MEKNTKFILGFVFYLLLVAYVFSSLLTNISTNLPDWRDYALVNWIINQNIDKIASLNFTNFFNTNAFYPHPYSLLFSDIFLPQSLMELPFLGIIRNIILSFNIIFFITLILNYLSSYLVWKQIFKRQALAFVGALLFCFSPFFHIEHDHFQMLNLWPFMFCLYFLFKNQEDKRIFNTIKVGVFLAIQFLASVYLSIFLLTTIFIFYAINALMENGLKSSLKKFLIILFVFVLLDGIFIKGYTDMKKYYGIQRELKEYVTYSASLSDYLFTTPINSIVHRSGVLQKWNAENKGYGAMAAFPGFTIFILSLMGLFVIKTRKENLSISLSLDKNRLFFITLTIVGFLFSLGPRLKFNGSFQFIPTPYQLLIKIVPFFEAARAPVRWSLLLYLGLIFFSLEALKNISKKVKISYLVGVVILFIFLEYIPQDFSTTQETYIDNHYVTLKNICSKQKEAVLEIPVTHLDVYPDIVTGVNYISKVELSSIYHKCNLVNGYSGYDMPSIQNLRDTLNEDININAPKKFVSDLKSNKVTIIKVNKNYLAKELRASTSAILKEILLIPNVTKIDSSLYYIGN